MIENVPSNGKPPARETIGSNEYALIMAKRLEIDHLKRKKALLEREMTLVSAQIYTKVDELEANIVELSKRYNLKKGEREINLQTGEIMTRQPVPARTPPTAVPAKA